MTTPITNIEHEREQVAEPSESPRPSRPVPVLLGGPEAEEGADGDEVALGEVRDAGGLHDHDEAERGQSETIAPLARPGTEERDEQRAVVDEAQIAQARKTRPTIVQTTRPRVQPPRRTSATSGGRVACGCSTSGVNSCSSAAGVSCTVSLTRPPRRRRGRPKNGLPF